MKRITILFIALFLTIGIASSQKLTREALLDSIATLQMKTERLSLFNTVNLFERGEHKNKLRYKNNLSLEIALYNVQKETFRTLFEECCKNISNEELEQYLAYINSEAVIIAKSNEVKLATAIQLIPPLFVEIVSMRLKSDLNRAQIGLDMELSNHGFQSRAPSMSSGNYSSKIIKAYKISDKRFSELYDEFTTQYYTNIDELYNIFKQQDNRSIKSEYADDFFDAMKRYLPHVHKKVLYDYISTNQLQEIVDFMNSPTGKKFNDLSLGEIFNKINSTEILSEEKMLARIQSYIDNLTPEDYEKHIEVRENMSLRPIKPRTDVTTVNFKKGTFTGETFEGVPNGIGTYTDKKGVKYSGNFKQGKMHGCITIEEPSGKSSKVMYANNKKMKVQSIGRTADGVAIKAPTYKDGETEYAMGYGYIQEEGVTRIGMFIDDNLEGEGEYLSDTETKKGIFKNDKFIEGEITNENSTRTTHFSGKAQEIFINTIYDGTYNYTNIAEKWTQERVGRRINYDLEGTGTFTEKTDDYTMQRRGYFAYDRMYGKGVEEFTREKQRYGHKYEGQFIDSRHSGEGELTLTAVNIYEGNYNISHEGFTFHSSAQSDTIKFKGTFEDKQFINGVIETSNGDRLEGTFKNGKLVDGKCNVSSNNCRMIISSGYASYKSYSGQIKNGHFEGEGKLIDSDNYTLEGTFQNNRLIKGTVKDEKGRFLYRYK